MSTFFTIQTLQAILLMDNVDMIKDTVRDLIATLRVDEPAPKPVPIVGNGEPPVPGAIPAITYRDKDNNLRIQLCRTYAGEGWNYTPVADGWVVITRE